MNIESFKVDMDRDGYIQVDGLLSAAEVDWYCEVYDRFLSGKIDAGALRSDLGGGAAKRKPGAERITQIMWPSELAPELAGSPAYAKALDIAGAVLGDDLAFDFDMLIDKAPRTGTPTPFHQDAAYWPALPDQRALSCWIALDEATQDNGCMWFVPGSHRRPLRKHWPAGQGGGALECGGGEGEAVCVPLRSGSCTFHNGGVVHYSRGNSTASHRRALILNFRPAAMIRMERKLGFDHGKTANVRVNRNEQTR